MTPLDAAHAAMLADPEDDLARLRYYRTLAATELCLMLDHEAVGDRMAPRIFPLEDGPVVLAFDGEDRLADFTSVPVPHAVLPGRALVQMLAGQGMGVGVNLSDPGTAWVMGAHAVDWLAEVLATAPVVARGRPLAFHAPGPLDPALSEALAVALSGAGGLAAAAVLAEAAWEGGRRGPLLVWLGASEGAEDPLARALAEALAFSGLDGDALDIVFLAPGDPAARALLALGQPLAVPEPPRAPERPAPPAPGMNPDKPPRLR